MFDFNFGNLLVDLNIKTKKGRKNQITKKTIVAQTEERGTFGNIIVERSKEQGEVGYVYITKNHKGSYTK